MLRAYAPIALDTIENLNQISFKNAQPDFWLNKIDPSLFYIIANLQSIFGSVLIPKQNSQVDLTGYQYLLDVKYWPLLEQGVRPVINDWHYDSFPTIDDPRSEHEFHVLWYQGVSRTEFASIGLTEPTKPYLYTHDELHRGTAAEATGPRLLIRLSHTRVPNRNQIIKPIGYQNPIAR